MFVKLSHRISSLTFVALALVVALSACSKKDVVQDEPLINPSEISPDEARAIAPEESVGTEGAGNAATAAETSQMEDIFFGFDSFTLTEQARGELRKHADWIKANAGATVQVEGHCDERGTTEYNLALGEKRAKAALDYLIKLGVPRKRLATVSYGEERPLDPGHDEAAWARNRRASFVVTSR